MKTIYGAILILTATLFSPAVNALPVPTGWSCTGDCGSLSADGVVTTSPNGGTYQYVTTIGTTGIVGVGALPTGLLGTETNGSVLDTSAFSAADGDLLRFNFNYVTSDGATFADYVWAALIDSANNSTILFTARTIAAGDVVPAFGTSLAPGVTLTPATTGILGGLITGDIGPNWSPLGATTCYDAGCGYTGWIQSDYIVPVAGTYTLRFGATNWDDEAWDSGLAIDGVLIAGTPVGDDVEDPAVPEPSTAVLLGLGTFALAFRVRRQRSSFGSAQ